MAVARPRVSRFALNPGYELERNARPQPGTSHQANPGTEPLNAGRG